MLPLLITLDFESFGLLASFEVDDDTEEANEEGAVEAVEVTFDIPLVVIELVSVVLLLPAKGFSLLVELFGVTSVDLVVTGCGIVLFGADFAVPTVGDLATVVC